MIDAKNIYDHIYHLTETIGIRLTGSQQEWDAATYLKSQFEKYVTSCSVEQFPVVRRALQEESLQVLIDGNWEPVPIRLFDMSPYTNDGAIKGDIVFFDSHTEYQRSDLSYLEGKAVLHYGGDIEVEEDYRRIMAAKPAFLMMVDTRYTAEYPISNSLLPALVRKYGAVPTVGIAFKDAWRLLTKGAKTAELVAKGTSSTGASCNVIAEIKGSDPNGNCIYMGAHMDSVEASVGADDNAGGCAILAELAKELSAVPHRHTIRLIAFGAEEQLSLGSADYVKKHAEEIRDKGLFMCNFDSCTTAFGWNRITINADPALRDRIRTEFRNREVFYEENRNLDPCNDAFPFMAAGVPGMTLMRNNCDKGRFYHHQPSNTIEMLSAEKAAQLAQACAELIAKMADGEKVTMQIDDTTKADVAALWTEIFGGWDNE